MKQPTFTKRDKTDSATSTPADVRISHVDHLNCEPVAHADRPEDDEQGDHTDYDVLHSMDDAESPDVVRS